MKRFLRNCITVFDRVFSRGMFSQMTMFVLLVGSVWIVIYAVLSFCQIKFYGGTCKFFDVYYVMTGGLDMVSQTDLEDGADTFVHTMRILVNVVGCLLFSGGLIAVCSNMMSRRVETYQKGFVHYSHENHFLIIGCGDSILGVLKSIFNGEANALAKGAAGTKNDKYEGEDIVLVTSGDAAGLRERILAANDIVPDQKSIRNRLFFYYGNVESENEIRRLCPERAKAIFVLGDAGSSAGQDVQSLSCMGNIANVFAKIKAEKEFPREHPVPVFVEIDRPETFSILQKVENFSTKQNVGMYPHPFNLHENYARKLWGLYGAPSSLGGNAHRPLDYLPITKDSSRHVHLFIVGLNASGTALLLEALRICHYANYETKQIKTKITIVDREFDKKRDMFFARFPNLDQIIDIDLDFRSTNFETPEIRDELAALARDPDCLLTVAVCVGDPEVAISAGLNLPEDVFRYENPEKSHGNTVLIRQAKAGALANAVDNESARYKNVRVFGMIGDDFDAALVSDKIPMRVNYDYNCFNAEKDDPFRHPVVELNEKTIPAVEKDWYALSEIMRWANRFQAETFRMYLRSIGYDVQRDGGKPSGILEMLRGAILDNSDMLSRMEHRRWVAERTLGGFVYGPVKDNKVRRTHPNIVDFDKLTLAEQTLDLRPLFNMSKFLTEDGWRFFKIDTNGNEIK